MFKRDNLRQRIVETAAHNPWAANHNIEVFSRLGEYSALGEKAPKAIFDLPATLENFSGFDFHYVHIFRPILEVAASYEARNNDPMDVWTGGWEQACRDFNRANAVLSSLDPKDSRFHWVDYGVLSNASLLQQLLGELGFTVGPDSKAVESFYANQLRRAKKGTPDLGFVHRVHSACDLEAARCVEAKFGHRLL